MEIGGIPIAGSWLGIVIVLAQVCIFIAVIWTQLTIAKLKIYMMETYVSKGELRDAFQVQNSSVRLALDAAQRGSHRAS